MHANVFVANSYTVTVSLRVRFATLTLYAINFAVGTKTHIFIISFLRIDMTQVVEIRPQVRQEHVLPILYT